MFALLFYFYLFIFGCAVSWLCLGFLQLQGVGTLSSCRAQASHCGGFSCGALAVGCMDMSCCGAGASLPCDLWDLLGQGIELVSSALAGTLSTTVHSYLEKPPLTFQFPIFCSGCFVSYSSEGRCSSLLLNLPLAHFSLPYPSYPLPPPHLPHTLDILIRTLAICVRLHSSMSTPGQCFQLLSMPAWGFSQL